MGRLIEAEKLWKAITTQIEEYCDITDLVEIIETQPTVDAVEVVRCKDCKHISRCGVDDWFFCAEGERREGDAVSVED